MLLQSYRQQIQGKSKKESAYAAMREMEWEL
jgi:hypothetical protein